MNSFRTVLNVTLAVGVIGLSGTADATSFGMFGTSPLAEHASKNTFDGRVFTVDVGLVITEPAGLSQFSMTATWPDELAFVSATGFVDTDFSTFATWAGAGLDGFPLFTQVIVGTITFQAINPVTDDLIDALLGPGPLPWLDGDGLEFTPHFGHLHVNAIPAPGSLLLLACSGLVAMRRRRRQPRGSRIAESAASARRAR